MTGDRCRSCGGLWAAFAFLGLARTSRAVFIRGSCLNNGNIHGQPQRPTAYPVWVQRSNKKHKRVARLMSASGCSFIFGLFAFLSLAFFAPVAQSSLPQRAADQNVQADEAMKSSDYSRAIVLYEEILRDQPDNASAQLHLARAYLLSRQFKAAISTYQLLLRHDLNNVDALIGTGEAYSLLEDYANAERTLEQGVRVAPGKRVAVWA